MEDAQAIIIPTRFRSKISHELSFPIGAEKISKALCGAPQLNKLVLHFRSDRWRQVRFHRYRCIRVQHSSRHADMADRFQDSTGVPLFNEWQIDVFPVPRIHRHRIKEYIVGVAFPEINEWLRKRGELQQPGEETLTFFFDEEKDELAPEFESRTHPQRK